MIIVAFKLDFPFRAFFLCEVGLFQYVDWRLVSINKLYVSVGDFSSFARNFDLTRFSPLSLNIIPTELRYTVRFKNIVGHMALEVVGQMEGRRQATMPPRSLLSRPREVGKKISSVIL
jgi:hypothetical protein